ncbi:protein-ADP-ribose hydrolase [Schaalia cardiffensis]|uniref:protein-ADP-ribose hydrolase n=1 Tax=Schaalia cardiffensis TaxID=181487 RepID=UPI0023F308CB|nr:protein-ADP-ribose hydrolase [Schaalia cardiffensis]
MEESRKRELLTSLTEELLAERDMEAPNSPDTAALWRLFRALVNTRPPAPIGKSWLKAQDELLSGLIAEAGITSLEEASLSFEDPRMRLWRGDITTMAVDAIVNAANSGLLGCWSPGHHCIDNAIHTFAGVQLRAECARLMDEQGHAEPTGSAKITGAYNLPSTHVIHTVGPIANGRPNDEHRAQLASCYRSCLDLAAKNGLHSIAFCAISTGVFAFPKEEAARIALRATREWLDSHEENMTVVFNVFSEEDFSIYSRLLGI